MHIPMKKQDTQSTPVSYTYLDNMAIGVICSDELIMATTRPGASLSRRCLVAFDLKMIWVHVLYGYYELNNFCNYIYAITIINLQL